MRSIGDFQPPFWRHPDDVQNGVKQIDSQNEGQNQHKQQQNYSQREQQQQHYSQGQSHTQVRQHVSQQFQFQQNRSQRKMLPATLDDSTNLVKATNNTNATLAQNYSNYYSSYRLEDDSFAGSNGDQGMTMGSETQKDHSATMGSTMYLTEPEPESEDWQDSAQAQIVADNYAYQDALALQDMQRIGAQSPGGSVGAYSRIEGYPRMNNTDYARSQSSGVEYGRRAVVR